MTTDHTPGPWIYRSDIEMVISAHPEWNTSSICKIASGEQNHDESNARLIAAAPDLLRALQAVLAVDGEQQEQEDDRYLSDLDRKAFRQARSAIAMATGKGTIVKRN